MAPTLVRPPFHRDGWVRKDAADLGMAFYIALLSAALGRPIGAQLVVLGR